MNNYHQKCNWTVYIVFILLFISFTPPLFAELYTKQTEHLRLIYYDKKHAFIVSHLARCFENSFRFHQQLFNYQSKEKITILLHKAKKKQIFITFYACESAHTGFGTGCVSGQGANRRPTPFGQYHCWFEWGSGLARQTNLAIPLWIFSLWWCS